MLNYGLPPKQGLYDPKHEHDACGIGFVADIKGRRSHDIVEKGLEVLVNLTHRGACGCDPETGDGAGLLLQMPHAFFERECDSLGIALPAEGQYGVGQLFFSADENDHPVVKGMVERVVAEEGETVLGWRVVPTRSDAIGWLARESEPAVEQVFIGRGEASKDIDGDAWERKLYVIAKRTESEARKLKLPRYYPCSMSARTICYKGLLIAPQIPHYFVDLGDELFRSAIALVHQRFSTNTFPTWERAQPFRYLAHNGEINTLRGNMNWMSSREATFSSPLYGDDIKKLLPIIDETGSDSAMIDNALELLIKGGRETPHAMMMLIPEAWSSHENMEDYKKAFYEYHATMMEPWDGPASIVFCDGRYVGGVLDRNGLRPSRYYVTHDDIVVMASEAGVLQFAPENIRYKGRLQPGTYVLGRHRRRPYCRGRGNQEDLFDSQALWRMARSTIDPRQALARAGRGSRYGFRHAARTSTDVRVHDGRPADSAGSHGRRRARADRIDGRRHAAGLPCRIVRSCSSTISSNCSRR